MTISVWGWGSTQISTWGWGSWVYEYVPELLGYYMDGPCWTCVIDTTGCVVVSELDSSVVVMRLRPCDIPERIRGDVLQRIADPILERERGEVLLRTAEIPIEVRSKGWPFQQEPCFGDE